MIFFVAETFFLCGGYYGICHWVRIMLFKTSRKTQHLVSISVAERNYLFNCRCGIGKRSCLIEHDSIRLGYSFKELTAFYAYLIITALTHCWKYGYRHWELQCTREVNHKHSQHLGYVTGQKISKYRSAERIWNKSVCKPWRFILRRGFEFFGLLYHLYYAVISSAAESFINAYDTFALFYYSTCIDIASLALSDREGFACHITCADYYQITLTHIIYRYERFGVACFYPYIFNVQRHCACKISHRLLMRPVLKYLTDIKHEHYRCCGLEVAS